MFFSIFSNFASRLSQYRDNVKERKRVKLEELNNLKSPSWKHRRRLIYLAFFLGLGMIVFGAVTYMTDTQVASQLVIGGVALISIILTAYTSFATFEDVRLWNQGQNQPYNPYSPYGSQNSAESAEEGNPDGE